MPQRSVLNALSAALLLLVLLLPAAGAAAADYASVSKDGVNIRSGPDNNKEVLWEVFKGFPLQILERQGKWAQVVDFEGDKGWIYAPLLSKTRTVIVKGKDVNLRVGPSTNYEVVATVKYGVVFVPQGREGAWVKVRHADGTVGWLHESLLWPADLP